MHYCSFKQPLKLIIKTIVKDKNNAKIVIMNKNNLTCDSYNRSCEVVALGHYSNCKIESISTT